METTPAQPTQLTQSDRFQAILDPFQGAFTALDQFLDEQVGSFVPEVQPLVRYCFGHSGKKLRPLLVFLMGKSADEAAAPSVVKAAAIVELVHLATLVHDDILDKADMRHRTETVVARYGSHVAVLLGDALFAHALHLAASYPQVEICRSVSLATRQVCSGEIAQTFSRGEDLRTDAYFRMIDLKTAELFAISAYLGGLMAEFEDDALESAQAYARHLGIAYQIYDDAADIFGRETQAGKTLGTDLATGKMTLPVLIWLDQLAKEDRQKAVTDLLDNRSDGAALRVELLSNGVLKQVEAAFREQIESARQAALKLPSESRVDRLLGLSDFVESAWNKFSIS